MLYNPTAGMNADSPARRRRFSPAGQSGVGMAGAEMTLGRLLPYILGAPYPNLAGFDSGMDYSGVSNALRGGAPLSGPANTVLGDGRVPVAGPNVAPAAQSGVAVTDPLFGPGGGKPTSGGTTQPVKSIGNYFSTDGRMPGNPAGNTYSKPMRAF